MTDEARASVEDKTAAIVAARRKRGPNKVKPPANAAPRLDAVAAAVAKEMVPAPQEMFAVQDADAPAPTRQPGRRLFPVKALRNYHPINDFTINGQTPTGEQRVKVFVGQEIEMDIDEARDAIAKGIVARNDPIG